MIQFNEISYIPYDFREVCIDNKHRVLAVREVDSSLWEVVSENGIATGEDGLTYFWILPAENIDQAINAFIRRIEEIRFETGYYNDDELVS